MIILILILALVLRLININQSLWLDEEGELHSSYVCKECEAEIHISYDRIMTEPIVLFDSETEEEIEVYNK